jgi:cysteine-rich repeat protein
LAWAWVLALSGCGLIYDFDPPDPDAGTIGEMDASSAPDAFVDPEDCGRARNGAPCGEKRICANGLCVSSECGDGIVDDRSEQCDDENNVFGDGCEPGSCRYSCTTSSDCVVLDARCAAASCSLEHVCVPELLLDGTGCDLDDGTRGACRGGVCASTMCGNRTREGDEECDDGNAEGGDGCEPDCTPSCREHEDCDDGLFCTGEEECVSMGATAGSRTCMTGSIVPTPVCTECSPTTGEFEPIDRDGDGFPSAEAGEACGDDCNDADPHIHPGAPDPSFPADGVNDDCDELTDEDLTTHCMRDADGDGWGDPADAYASSEGCEEGYVAGLVDATRAVDCNDGDARVFPGQLEYFSDSLCATPEQSPPCFDYDCDGRDELQLARRLSCSLLSACEATGWVGGVPECGQEGRRGRCVLNLLGLCVGEDVTSTATQACH